MRGVELAADPSAPVDGAPWDVPRTVYVTGIGSAALLAGIIQTPGLSHFFGCRPIGPFGWATAIGASAAVTSLPALSHLVRDWLLEEDSETAAEPEPPIVQLPPMVARLLAGDQS